MENKNKPAPEKELTLTIGTNEYKIKFPNNGQFLDIQAMKHQIAGNGGIYSSMSTSMDSTSQYGATTIDMIATFNVLIGPKLKEDLTVKSLLDLGMMETRDLIDVYIDQYIPWYNGWMNIITAPKSKEEDETKAS